MSLLLHLVFVYSVFLHTIDGASVAQTDNGYQTFTSQRNVRKDTHSITEVATGFLDEVPSKLHISQGWQKAKNMAEMVANKTYHVLNGLVMSSSVINKDNNGDPTKNTSTPLEKTSALSNSSSQTSRESSLAPVSVKSIDADKCEESPDLNCLNWKILKTVGASIGAGFVLGIFSPVLFYFIIVTIGGFGYGVIFMLSAIVCQFKIGRETAEHFAERCQQIGASCLHNMFKVFPIVLTWFSSGCLIGWLMWPYY